MLMFLLEVRLVDYLGPTSSWQLSGRLSTTRPAPRTSLLWSQPSKCSNSSAPYRHRAKLGSASEVFCVWVKENSEKKHGVSSGPKKSQ